MATITTRLSSMSDSAGTSELLIRLSGGRGCSMRAKGRIRIPRKLWNEKTSEIPIPRMTGQDQLKAIALRKKIAGLCDFVCTEFALLPERPTDRRWLQKTIDSYVFPKNETSDFFSAFDEFLSMKKISLSRRAGYTSVRDILRRFELYSGKKLEFDSLSPAILSKIEVFMLKEWKIFKLPKYA